MHSNISHSFAAITLLKHGAQVLSENIAFYERIAENRHSRFAARKRCLETRQHSLSVGFYKHHSRRIDRRNFFNHHRHMLHHRSIHLHDSLGDRLRRELLDRFGTLCHKILKFWINRRCLRLRLGNNCRFGTRHQVLYQIEILYPVAGNTPPRHGRQQEKRAH